MEGCKALTSSRTLICGRFSGFFLFLVLTGTTFALSYEAAAQTVLPQNSFAQNGIETSGVQSSIGVSSNTVWRGISKSNDRPGASAGFSYQADSGVYLGTKASTIDWEKGSSYELDFFGGYEGVTRLFDYDLGLNYYSYPEQAYEDSDLAELYVNLGVRHFKAGVAYTLSGQSALETPYGEGDIYTWVGYSIPVYRNLELGLTTGYYLFDEDEANFGNNDYGHIQLDLSYYNFVLSLSRASENAGQEDTLLYLTWVRQFSF